MTLFDLPLAELESYRPILREPDGLEAFWAETINAATAAARPATFTRVDSPFTLVDSYDVTFSGYGGDSVKAWLHVPAGATGPLPTVVTFAGYSGGRGLSHQWVDYALAGYAHFAMDTRGQGYGGAVSHTPDPHVEAGLNQAAGFMTRGILDKNAYYYRRVYTDAVRAVEAATEFEFVDASRVVVAGVSQGGGIAIAAAALSPRPIGALVDVPFLCHFERALTITNNDPYQEIVRYLKRNRGDVTTAYETLSYFDGAVLASRADIPALFSVALMDQTCPPSTVYAAFNRWDSEDKRIAIYPFNEHEGGQEFHDLARFDWLKERFAR